MRIRKATIIRQLDKSSWTSCQTITQNLFDLYHSIPEIEIQKVLEIESPTPFSTFEKGFELSTHETDLLIFIDHFPCPASIIKSFSEQASSRPIDIIIHIFGDFTLQAAEWLSAEEELKNFNIKFICASDAQASLLGKLIQNEKSIDSFFFPLNEYTHKFSSETRNKKRHDLNLSNDDIVFVYTGRLSMQKNVVELSTMFNEINKLFNLNLKLLIAGPFDDLGIPYIGQYSHEGAYATRWLKSLENISCVKYLGILDSQELHELYCASDCFISLSTHNDEDFGMSPCEAAATGLPLILTNWGGYYSFSKYFENVSLVETSFNDPNSTRPLPLKKSLIKNILHFIENYNPSVRKPSQSCSLSIMKENIQGSLEGLEYSKFQGFTEMMIKVAARFSATENSPFSGVRGNYSDLYFDLYSSYVKKDHNV
ncbi:glycosyltransferase [Halobacteriovorax marinus]|uniref:glycosyltransferase n=1 Tax=Halobacteriovorax marinus TaxID=97084 RepID=UPI003A953D10